MTARRFFFSAHWRSLARPVYEYECIDCKYLGRYYKNRIDLYYCLNYRGDFHGHPSGVHVLVHVTDCLDIDQAMDRVAMGQSAPSLEQALRRMYQLFYGARPGLIQRRHNWTSRIQSLTHCT